MLDVGGQDSTEAFEDVGHSDEAREILEGLLIGKLKREVRPLSRLSKRLAPGLALADRPIGGRPKAPRRDPTRNILQQERGPYQRRWYGQLALPSHACGRFIGDSCIILHEEISVCWERSGSVALSRI